jgi:hypothetical protein
MLSYARHDSNFSHWMIAGLIALLAAFAAIWMGRADWGDAS